MRRRPAIYPPTAAAPEPSIADRAEAIRQAVARDQLARAQSAMMVFQSIRWDGHAKAWVLPSPGSVAGDLVAEALPPEFQRRIPLSRLEAAITDRMARWAAELGVQP